MRPPHPARHNQPTNSASTSLLHSPNHPGSPSTVFIAAAGKRPETHMPRADLITLLPSLVSVVFVRVSVTTSSKSSVVVVVVVVVAAAPGGLCHFCCWPVMSWCE